MDHSLAQYLFHQGTNYRSYEYLGAHFEKRDGKSGVVFRVWANNAESVSIVGDFNGWNDGLHVMQNLGNGIFELFIEGVNHLDNYKYAVKTHKGVTLKADPFAFYSELAPNTASRVYKFKKFNWTDGEFIKNKNISTNHHNLPMNIYEVNLNV